MSDDLVKRLRHRVLEPGRPYKSDATVLVNPQGDEAADRIEELEATLLATCKREAATQARHDAKVAALEAERDALRKPENAAACILAGGMRVIAPVVLNAVQAEREKWEQNPDVKRGKVSPETITLAMFEACLRAITEITGGKTDG